MSVALQPVAVEAKGVLRELLNLYLYELSHLAGSDPNEHGRFEYRWLDHYWTESDRHAYFIDHDGARAGFVLVNAHTATDAEHAIAEFFVLKRHRRAGVGARAAALAFDAHPGEWEVCTDVENARAARFWRATIARYTGDTYVEHPDGIGDWTGPCFTFRVDLPPRAHAPYGARA